MDECLLTIQPVLPGARIVEGFGQRAPKLVNRRVEAELNVGVDVLVHRLGQGAKKLTIMGGGCVEIRGMIESVLARREVLGVVPSACSRTHLVHAASLILQKRADDICRGMLKGCERKHLFGMRCQTSEKIRKLIAGERAADVVGDQEDLVREYVHAQAAACRAAFTAREFHCALLEQPTVQVIESVE